jgi:hypothetical protein
MEIGEFLRNPMQPEGKTMNEMQLFRREATKYHLSDGILIPRRKTNEIPAKVFVSVEQQKKAMEAS